MKKIVCTVSPFKRFNSCYVFVDNENKEIVDFTMDNLINTIFELINKYNIQDIDLVGIKSYLEPYQKNILNSGLSNYSELKVNIISS